MIDETYPGVIRKDEIIKAMIMLKKIRMSRRDNRKMFKRNNSKILRKNSLPYLLMIWLCYQDIQGKTQRLHANATKIASRSTLKALKNDIKLT